MRRTSAAPVGEELERLGAIGENRFKDLCDRARLTCSRPTPDRTGKDFLVEFPLDPHSAVLSYDIRKPPRKIAVQVKTVTSGDRPAVLALSVAERLTKDGDPAVVCLFLYDAGVDDLVEMRLIHLLGDNLAKVMKRLRQAYVAGRKSLHRSSISFPQSAGFLVAMQPTALSKALSTLVRPDMEAYAVEKLRQIHTVGYGDDRLKMSFSFSELNEDEVVDAFLGLRDLPIQAFELRERRFDIELPAHDLTPFDGGRLTVQPDPIGRCRLVASVVAGDIEHDVDADIYVVPAGLVGSEPTYLFKWAMGRAKLLRSGKTCKLTLDWDTVTARTVGDWRRELRFVRRVISEDCAIHARGSDLDAHVADVSWSEAEGMEWLEPTCRLVEAYDEVFDETGLRDERFSISALFDHRHTIAILHAMRSRNIKLTSRSEGWTMPRLDGASGLYITAAEIAGRWIGLALPMDFWTERSGSQIDWTCYKSGEPTFQLIEGEVEGGFERFRKSAQRLARPECSFVQTPGNFLAEEGMILDTDLILENAR